MDVNPDTRHFTHDTVMAMLIIIYIYIYTNHDDSTCAIVVKSRLCESAVHGLVVKGTQPLPSNNHEPNIHSKIQTHKLHTT